MDLGLRLKKINDMMEKIANRGLKKYDLTFSQFHVLIYLYRKSDNTAPLKELEKKFQVAQATMAGIAARLENKGLVSSTLDERDKRVKLISLTNRGAEFCSNARKGMQNFEEEKVAAIYTPEELKQFNIYLEKIYDALVELDKNLK